jgi:hypothetical protein
MTGPWTFRQAGLPERFIFRGKHEIFVAAGRASAYK